MLLLDFCYSRVNVFYNEKTISVLQNQVSNSFIRNEDKLYIFIIYTIIKKKIGIKTIHLMSYVI